MRLRPLNKSRRQQIDQLAASAAVAMDRHDREFADRDPNGNAVQRVNARFHAMMPEDDKLPGLPDRHMGSEQSVVVFRPITVANGLHPEALALFADDELSHVEDPARSVQVLDRMHYRHFDHVENSEHAALVGFQTEAQEKSDKAHEKKRADRAAKNRRRAERAGHKVAQNLAEPVDEETAKKARAEAEKWAGKRRELKAEIADRLQYGHFFPGGDVAGHHYPKFWEFFGEGVLRSHLGWPALARMAALYPSAESGDLRAGNDKEVLLSTTCKLFALDAPYVELNRKMAGCIVVELDSVLRVEEFREALLALLGPHRMPNLIVGRITASGFMSRPHLIWILRTPVWYEPYKEWTDDTGEVHSSGNKRCKTKPIAKFHAVQRALTQLLLPLGADPACWNIWKPKCPLSPFWTTVVANDDCWHDLDEFDQIKGWPREVDEHAMAKTAAKMRAEATGATPTASNLAWKTVGHEIVRLSRLQLSARDPDFIAASQSTPALAAWFDEQARPVVEAELGRSDALDRILKGRCTFAANYCRGRLSRRGMRKGRGRDLNDPLFIEMPAEQRIEETAKRSAAHRRSVSLYRLRKDMTVALNGGELRKREFIRDHLGEVSPSTAYKLFDEAISTLGTEFRDGAHRYIAQPTSVQSDQPAPSKQPIRASNPTLPTTSATPFSGHPAQTIDPPWVDPVIDPGTAGPPDPPWQTCVPSAAEVRQHVDRRIPEPA
jgi:hypothetical protein